jgi:putative glutamine amidotransferase
MNNNIKNIKPRIGITVSEYNRLFSWLSNAFTVKLFGGKPILLDASKKIDNNLEDLDGIIFSGGTDINPGNYGKVAKLDYSYDYRRDSFELSLFHRAEKQNIPIMGICRGAQLINIAKGGSLFSDLSEVTEDTIISKSFWQKVFSRKTARVLNKTNLMSILDQENIVINSIHHQSISYLGDDLKVSAVEPNGIVQAVEHQDNSKFILGVQWHPELLFYDDKNFKIYKSFLKEAKKKYFEKNYKEFVNDSKSDQDFAF